MFRNEHNHYGFAVRAFLFWFCSLFRFSGGYHFLVARTLQGKHFRRNPLSRRYTWRKQGPVSKEKDVRRHLLPWHRICSASKRPVSLKRQACFHFRVILVLANATFWSNESFGQRFGQTTYDVFMASYRPFHHRISSCTSSMSRGR